MIRILVIDDEEQICSLISMMLEENGYKVETANNGNEAIKKFTEKPFDLIITDLMMPEKEGLETIIDLKEIYPAVKIIAMSGGLRNQDVDFLKTAKIFGASITLRKPFNTQTLLNAVNEVLQNPVT